MYYPYTMTMTSDNTQQNKDQETSLLSPQAAREEEILAFWDKERIFEKTLEANKESPKGDFVFYDGPPYATGLPHFGHLLPSTVKDAIPRFKTMQGYNVPRRWGWDCHGLPIENLIEKELNLPDKKAIIEYGIDKFNKAARDSVFRYDAEWKKVIHRMGRFVDMDNAYHTMDPSYTESVWSSFKRLHEKGLVYEGHRVMQICPRCETTLSNFEVGQGYKDVQDISVYVLFELKNEPNTYFLAWTTTPWTLHGNAALAVNPEQMYEKILIKEGEHANKKIILMSARKEVLKGEEGKDWETVEKISGKDLVGLAYTPIFTVPFTQKEIAVIDDAERMSKAWHVYGADFVTADSGTGIVHIAPGYGDDDYKLGSAHGVPVILHVGLNGLASQALGEPFAGRAVKVKGDTQSYDIEVIKTLAHTGKLFAKEKITHSYPHCWRCDTPLLNLATSAWFVEVTKLQQKFIEQNNTVKWIPESVGSGRFGTWLENLRDWNISRARFWGAPLPIWRGAETGKLTVLGTIDELKSYIPKRNNFTLIRHGQAESNLTGAVNSKDLTINGLTDLGRQEVRASIEALKEKKKITKIYASDFRRTKETALIAAEILGIDQTEIIFDRRLRECDPGEPEGSNWMEHWAKFDSQYKKMFESISDPETGAQGECVADVKRRATEFLYDIDAQLEGEEVLIVTHGLPLRMMKYASQGKTARDLVRDGWSDISDPNGQTHNLDWRALPHNETFELDLHRPYIDHVTWTDPETGEAMIRVPDVFDVWYDSGSMPFAQNNFLPSTTPVGHKPSTSQFPADFIAEGLDQTRGWFYSLLALGVGLFDTVPYKHVMVNGLILAEDGRKMSKSLKNYPPLGPTIDKYGVDALRYFLASSPATHAEEVAFSEKGLDEVNKKVFNRLDNMYSFLDMYTGQEPEGSELWKLARGSMTEVEIAAELSQLSHPLDVWAIARLNQTIQAVSEGFEGYMIDKATRPIGELVDDMSRSYLKRSRDRFKGSDGDVSATKSQLQAVFVTRYILEQLSRLMAPVTPFMAEYLYGKVKFGNVLSVHLESWPAIPAASDAEMGIISEMKQFDEVVERGLALRAEAKIKVRQVLQSFTYPKDVASFSQALTALIADELNVKEVIAGDVFALDTVITPELQKEGYAREIIRAIQQERKNKDLQPKDSIVIVFNPSTLTADIEDMLKTYQAEICKTVSATEIRYEITPTETENTVWNTVDIGGQQVQFTMNI